MTSLPDTFTNVPHWELDPGPTIDPSSIAWSTIPCASVSNDESMEVMWTHLRQAVHTWKQAWHDSLYL